VRVGLVYLAVALINTTILAGENLSGETLKNPVKKSWERQSGRSTK
jgi:hypothetical protein